MDDARGRFTLKEPMYSYNMHKKNDFFWKGRVALYAILQAIDIEPGEEVIIPGFTCVVVPNTIIYVGAKPVYVDIDFESYNIDPSKIEEKITKKTRAIIAQHTFGIPAEMDEILAIAKKYNLYVIEDSCHAIGSKYKGKEAGTIGDAAFFSSQWSKPVTTGLGGWAKINNPDLIPVMERIYPEFKEPSLKEILSLRLQYLLFNNFISPSTYLRAKEIYGFLYRKGIITGSSSADELSCRMPSGFKKRMSQWQLKKLEEELSSIDKVISHRKKISKIYENRLPDIGYRMAKLPDYMDIVYLRYPVLVENKEEILKQAKKEGIEIGDWFVSPVHPNTAHWEVSDYRKGMCPIAEEICKKVVNLPTHIKISEKEAEKIIQFLSMMS